MAATKRALLHKIIRILLQILFKNNAISYPCYWTNLQLMQQPLSGRFKKLPIDNLTLDTRQGRRVFKKKIPLSINSFLLTQIEISRSYLQTNNIKILNKDTASEPATF